MSPLSSLALPSDLSTPTVQQRLDAYEQVLNTRIPPRSFVCTPTSAQLAAIAAGKRVRLTPPLTQRAIRPDEIGGEDAARPLSLEAVNETGSSYVDALCRQVADYFKRYPDQYPSHLPSLPKLKVAGEPRDSLTAYSTEADLEHLLSQEVAVVGEVMGNMLGETWFVGLDSSANRASSVPVTAADLVLRRLLINQWEGSLSELKAVLTKTFKEGHAKMVAMETFPCMVERKGGTPWYWNEASGELLSPDPTLRLAVQLHSIVTSRIRRSQHEGLDNPYVPLIVTNGSIFFVVLGRIDPIDGVAYGRLGFTRVESLADYPLRLLFFGHALMHRLNPILPPPPGFSLDQALKSTVQPSVAFKSQAKAEEALRALAMAKRADDTTSAKGHQESDDTEGGNRGGAGARAGGVAGGGEARDVRHFSASSRLAAQPRAQDIERELALPLRFELVVAWWGEGQGRSKPRTFELVTARDSPPTSAPTPTVVLDKLLSKVDSLSVAKSTALNLVFKKAWVADERAAELLNEGAIFDELYRQDDAADFLVGYAGFFESTNESHYLLVTEAGETLEDWTIESDAVIKIVEQLHQHGCVHGDLAERNIVRTPAGLRLIDLGRAMKANAEDRAREMEQLKKVLAGEADELDYNWLGY